MSNKNNRHLNHNETPVKDITNPNNSLDLAGSETVDRTDCEKIIEENSTAKIDGVVNCHSLLNVRKTPTVFMDNVIGCISSGEKVSINLSESKGNWYKVSTENGLEGYCSKKFIDLTQ